MCTFSQNILPGVIILHIRIVLLFISERTMYEINKYYKKAEFALKIGNYAEGAEHVLTGLNLLKEMDRKNL